MQSQPTHHGGTAAQMRPCSPPRHWGPASGGPHRPPAPSCSPAGAHAHSLDSRAETASRLGLGGGARLPPVSPVAGSEGSVVASLPSVVCPLLSPPTSVLLEERPLTTNVTQGRAVRTSAPWVSFCGVGQGKESGD